MNWTKPIKQDNSYIYIQKTKTHTRDRRIEKVGEKERYGEEKEKGRKKRKREKI